MEEGTLEVVWTNRNDRSISPVYQIKFLRYGPSFQGGGQPRKEFIGDPSLFDYFLSLQNSAAPIERRTDYACEWLRKIHAEGRLSLTNVYLDEEQVAPFCRTDLSCG